MKTSCKFPLVSLTIMLAFLFSSCTKKNTTDSSVKGNVQFSFSMSEKAAVTKGNGTDSILMSYQLMISVEDLKGNPVLTDKLIPVFAFGSGFVSEKIEISAGEFNLTKFLVIDPSGQVLYASPMEGSPLAYLANDPLPVQFNILPGQITTIAPEVLLVGTYTPGDFGYVSFGIQIIKPLELWAICVLDNPLVMAPTQITDAKLIVYSGDGWSFTFNLKAEVNHLVIRGGSDFYTFLLEKEGYPAQTLQFSGWELSNTSQENPLILKIPWGPQYRTMVIQPGPEDGKDAMISNLEPDKNFGDYKYFEATFLSEPILTVMRSNRSLISFNLDSLPKNAVIQKVILELSYDIPIPVPGDSTVIIDPSTGVNSYAGVFQQIIEPWDEHKVTWNNQPKTIEMNQVFLYPFIKNSNIVDIDVTSLFNNPSASALPNLGMLFREWPDDSFPGFRFVSSDYPVASMRPKLIIYYTA